MNAGGGQPHLVLIGLTGTGKSTVGRLCAERLGRPFVDCDHEIERVAGRSVRAIFEELGEDSFRDYEHHVLIEVLERHEPQVVATGGGVVLRDDNRARLRADDVRVVWLQADPSLLLDRVRSTTHRPLLDDDPASTLQTMWATREPLYREVADAIVSVDNRSVADVADAVLR